MKRFLFPVVNALAVALLFGLIGYFVSDMGRWIAAGIVVGLGIGLLAEFSLKWLGRWIYRRRVLLVVLAEIPLMVFGVAPYAYAVMLAQPAPASVCCATPADFGAVYQTVSIPAADGIILAGWFIAPTAPQSRVILLMHGGGGNRLGTMWHAEQLYGAGYGALMVDQRALGESTGDHQSWGWFDARDVPYLLNFIAAQPGVDGTQIGGVGLSLGAHIVLNGALDEPRLSALWLDGLGAGSMEDFPPAQNLSEQFSAFMNRLVLQAMVFHLNTPPPPPVQSLIPRIAPRPLMLIVSPLDEFEYRTNLGYAPMLGKNGDMWVIEGAVHVGGASLVPDQYTQRMIQFFDAAFDQKTSP